MKKLFLIFVLLASFTYAQNNDKGNISFIFNGENINLPVTTITIRKQNDIIVSARAERNDSTIQKMISLEIGFKKLAPGDSSMSPLINIDIRLQNSIDQTGNNLSIRYDNNGVSSGKENYKRAHYGVYSKGERLDWDINNLSIRFNISKVEYVNSHLMIIGEFSGKFSSTIAPKGKFAEIKNGKFELII